MKDREDALMKKRKEMPKKTELKETEDNPGSRDFGKKTWVLNSTITLNSNCFWDGSTFKYLTYDLCFLQLNPSSRNFGEKNFVGDF